MATFILRVWLPDRPGALGQVASRIGAVRGSVVGIDILERGADRAIDELTVELDDEEVVDLLVAEVNQVDGVNVESVRSCADGLLDPALAALEAASSLVAASHVDELLDESAGHARRVLASDWAAIVDLDEGACLCSEGEVPPAGWLVAFVEGSQASARGRASSSGPDDVAWAPLASAGLAMVLGRAEVPYRARERRQLMALSRIVTSRLAELSRTASRLSHPSCG